MALKDKAPPHLHMRCPCCGRLGRLGPADVLPKVMAVDHDLNLRKQVFLGDHGFDWTNTPMSKEQIRALRRLWKAIGARLMQLDEETT